MLSVTDGSLVASVGCRDARHLLGWTGDVLEEDNRKDNINTMIEAAGSLNGL